jgi:hypothetical protein
VCVCVCLEPSSTAAIASLAQACLRIKRMAASDRAWEASRSVGGRIAALMAGPEQDLAFLPPEALGLRSQVRCYLPAAYSQSFCRSSA